MTTYAFLIKEYVEDLSGSLRDPSYYYVNKFICLDEERAINFCNNGKICITPFSENKLSQYKYKKIELLE